MFLYFPENYRWSLAVLRAIAAGGLFGEIDWACSRLKEAAGRGPSGDLEAWHAAWRELGRQLEDFAVQAADAGSLVSASDSFLRASVYYQWAEGLLDPDDGRAAAMYGKHLSCFAGFAAHRDPAIEVVEIPFGAQTIPAYVVPAAGVQGRAPAVLLSDGLDANKEEMFYVALSLARRGVTTVAFDGPGQGAALRLQGMTARHDFEVPVSACIDWLQQRADVDPGRIGLLAASWGGYYAPRAAAFEKRIKACGVMGAVFDTHACMARRVGYVPGQGATQLGGNAPLGTTGKNILRILGAPDWESAFARLEDFRLESVASRIECDLMIVHGANDRHAPPSEAQRLYDAVSSPHKRLRVFTEAEGGAAHVNLDRPEPALSMICDWMAQRLGKEVLHG
ncbi:MAG: alpha/beta hydrolase [Burkholderiales bacterium]|nr:alpha/beta hydrolase [Burkholderiales bacterium]